MQSGWDEETLLYYTSSSWGSISPRWRSPLRLSIACEWRDRNSLPPPPTGSSQKINPVGVWGAKRNDDEQCIAERNVQYLSTFISKWTRHIYRHTVLKMSHWITMATRKRRKWPFTVECLFFSFSLATCTWMFSHWAATHTFVQSLLRILTWHLPGGSNWPTDRSPPFEGPLA